MQFSGSTRLEKKKNKKSYLKNPIMYFAKRFSPNVAQVTDELNTYDTDGGFGGFQPFGWWWPRPSGGEDADDVFRVC